MVDGCRGGEWNGEQCAVAGHGRRGISESERRQARASGGGVTNAYKTSRSRVAAARPVRYYYCHYTITARFRDGRVAAELF